MKNVIYIIVLILVIFFISYLMDSCSIMLENEFQFEDLEGKIFENEDGNKIIFNHDNIYLYYGKDKFIFTDFEKKVDNMISLATVNDILEVEEIRLYILKNDKIYSTLDGKYYQLISYYEK